MEHAQQFLPTTKHSPIPSTPSRKPRATANSTRPATGHHIITLRNATQRRRHLCPLASSHSLRNIRHRTGISEGRFALARKWGQGRPARNTAGQARGEVQVAANAFVADLRCATLMKTITSLGLSGL
ncbi:hypothetical protein CIB48_g12273 [Xylaria polymorpha]|nr:hypothetical protein CIB48_g12273 [Xylaria polymorpha]